MHLLEPLNLPLLRLFRVAAWYIDSEQLCQGIIIHLRREQSSKQTVCCSDSVLLWSRVNQSKNKLFSSAPPSTFLFGPQTLFMVNRLFSWSTDSFLVRRLVYSPLAGLSFVDDVWDQKLSKTIGKIKRYLQQELTSRSDLVRLIITVVLRRRGIN